jgi:hypothetical protein
MERARALASVVFPVPGKSSSSTCPPLAKAARSLRIAALWPFMTRPMLAARRWETSRGGRGAGVT